jgi:hypothetical protein
MMSKLNHRYRMIGGRMADALALDLCHGRAALAGI